MNRKTQNPETIGSLFEFLFEDSEMVLAKIAWPPDAFCFCATALQRSSAYTALVGSKKPNLSFKHNQESRADALEKVGLKWRLASAKGKYPPQPVGTWFATIRENRGLSLNGLVSRRKLLAVLMNLLAAADEACHSLGISLTSTENDAFATIAEARLVPTKDGSTLCRSIHPSRARVLPKCHTPQTGLTIRSFSNFLALASSTEVRPEWYSYCDNTSQHALNLLLIPWPNQVIPRQFRAVATEHITDDVDRGGYGLFTFDPLRQQPLRHLRNVVKAAEETVGRVDGIVLPELALSAKMVHKISAEFVREDRFLIAGVGRPGSDGTDGENYIRFDVMLPGGEFIAELKQKKHHRWRLERNQIMQYGIGAVLNPRANWWEQIDVTDRRMVLVTLKPWLTSCVLLCEDLARPDPLGELIHAVGPNLLICLLMDGPQLTGRWPGRYATSLADDPGCSVLTLTSAGMANLSRPASGPSAPSGCIALWKDSRTGSAKEIVLPAGADAMVLGMAVEYCEEWTADKRGDYGNAGHPYLVGQHPIYTGKRV